MTKIPVGKNTVTWAIARVKKALSGVVLFSAGVNILMLAGPLYMLQIYDRVLTSNSVPTLVGLTVFVIGAYGFQAALEIIRSRVVVRSANVIDNSLQNLAHESLLTQSATGSQRDAVQPLRDIDQIRSFIMSPGPVAIIDSPWVPVFLIICFLIHPWLGSVALVGAIVLVAITLLTERASRPISQEMAKEGRNRDLAIESRRRTAESAMAMGMQRSLENRWNEGHARYVDVLQNSSDVTGTFGALSKVSRLMLQSMILGLGAYLVILQQLTPGSMIAASIMMGRALAPIESAISQWRGFVAARQASQRLKETIGEQVSRHHISLPAPSKELNVEALTIGPPTSRKPTIRQLNFKLNSGEAVGVIGPSGIGKSTLARTLVGIWPALAGKIRLDGAELSQWQKEELGPHVGYLSQSVEIFNATIAENIARLEESPNTDAIIAAAKAAGAHEMILQLPEGYDTIAGEWGVLLSAGQRQRIGLARALYGDPAYVILDEPNNNLDSAGEMALLNAIRHATQRGAIVVLITHKLGLLSVCDKALLLADGRQRAFGPRDEILRKFFGPTKSVGNPNSPLRAVPSETGGGSK